MGDDPPFLPVGTEVSAKFKGAYCEARVNIVHRELRVKVNIKESPFGVVLLPCSEFSESTRFEAGEITRAMHGGSLIKCQIVSVKDASHYHVVFNDGDEKTLRRSQMVPKGKKHYPTEGNLDMMPLTNPESFSSPVVRGAAKRGAQKIKTMNSDSDSGGRKRHGDDDDEPVIKKLHKQKGRRAATSGHLNETIERESQSDESSVELSEEKEHGRGRRRRRDEERPGPSMLSHISSDDETDVPSTSNGTTSAVKSEKIHLREKKQQEKIEARRKKNEDRERKRTEYLVEKQRKNQDKLMKKEASRKSKSLQTTYKSATVKAVERDTKTLEQGLARPSMRYTLRLHNIGKKKRRKKVLKRQHVSLRNCRLVNVWINICRVLGMSDRSERHYQWKQISSEDTADMSNAAKILKRRWAKKLAVKWLKDVEHERDWKVVLLYKNPSKARRLLTQLTLPEELTFSQRLDMTTDDVRSKYLTASIKNDEWYLGILLPQVFPPQRGTDSNERLVRHMVTGNLVRVWEDDLIPLSWVPDLSRDTMKRIVKMRPANTRRAFRLAWKFVIRWRKSKLCNRFIRAFLHLRDIPSKRVTIESGLPTAGPPPPEITDEEELENSEESEYESDESILNASEEARAQFTATYFEYFEIKRATFPPAEIQNVSIDIFYLYHLVKKFGGPRKASAAGPHWATFARKVLPQAVSAGDELRMWFRSHLEPFMMIHMKLDMPAEGLYKLGERKPVRPGQYSEARKRKSVTLQDVGPSTSSNQTPTTYSISRRGGRGGGRGRRRKSSVDSRHKGKHDRRSSSRRGSRATTASPEPEDTLNEEVTQSDDDDTASSLFSADGSERKGTVSRQKRQRKTPTRTTGSRNSRSMSARHDDPSTSTPTVPAKKGRPRKSGAASTANKPTSKPAKPRICDLTGFVFANILSQIYTAQDLHACYKDGGWWAATAISGMDDYSQELLDVMLAHQASNPSYVTTMSSDSESQLKEIYDRLKVATHYKGWNQRYDEDMKLDKLMVKAEDQLESRRRFLRLPRGSELLPETMALVEEKMTTQHQITDGNRPRPRVSREEFVRLAREALGSTRSNNEEIRQEVRKRVVQYSDDEPPEEVKQDDSESEKSDGDDQPGPSMRGEDKKEEERATSGEEDDDDDDVTVVMAPSSKSEYPERKSPDPAYLERGFESESDEPEYPPGPSSPELLAMRPPVLQNIASLDRISSSGSSNYPVLSRQASSTSVSSSMQSVQSLFSPPNSLSHSGPLTLAEVPPSASSSSSLTKQRHDNQEESLAERIVHKGAGDAVDAEPASKKSRKDEDGTFRGISSPIRLPVTPSQFQSGALTLDIPPPLGTSGPIEPAPSSKKGRKKTGTPVFQKPSPSITSSGPLTLSPSKARPPGASPIGRPKKKSLAEPIVSATSTSTETDHEDEESRAVVGEEGTAVLPSEATTGGSISGKESQDGTSGSTTPATIDDKEDDSTDKEREKTPQATARGFGGSNRGKRKRGGRFGGSYSTKPTKVIKKKDKDENGDDKDDDTSAPFTVPTPTHSTRADSFQVQKNRMAKLMEQEGTHEDYHLLDFLSDFDLTLSSMPPEDIPMALEERTSELRDAHGQCKQELSQLEKRFRLQNEAKRKAAEAKMSSTNVAKN